MDDDIKNLPLSEEQMRLVAKGAEALLFDALLLTDGDPVLAIGAMSLALASSAVLSKIPIDVLITMMSMHYANQVMQEAVEILKNAGANVEVETPTIETINVKGNKDLN